MHRRVGLGTVFLHHHQFVWYTPLWLSCHMSLDVFHVSLSLTILLPGNTTGPANTLSKGIWKSVYLTNIPVPVSRLVRCSLYVVWR